MKSKRWRHPFDPKTGRAVFTPILWATGEWLDLEVDYASFPRSKALGFHGQTQDLKLGKRYAVYGKECDIPGCNWSAVMAFPQSQHGESAPDAPPRPRGIL
jgi:hypothetical protein